MTKNKLPPISQLFRESWQVFTQSARSLFFISILVFLLYFLFTVIAGALFFLLGGNPFVLIITIILASVSLLYYVVVSTLVVNNPGKIALKEVLKKALNFIIPLFLVNLISSVLIFGAFFVLFLPGLLVSFFLNFAYFEVIFHNKKLLGAIKSSVTIISTNFWSILPRFIIMLLLNIPLSVVQNILLRNVDAGWQIIVNIITLLISIPLGWYMLTYQITLYKHAREGLENKPEKNILWMWIVSIIGWLMFAGLIFASWKFMPYLVKNFQKSKLPSSKEVSIQNPLGLMSPQAKIHFDRSEKLMQQMRVLQTSGKSDSEIIAAITKLNDENIAEIKKALEIEPKNAKLWQQLCFAYTWLSSTGSSEERLAACKKTEELEPHNVEYINSVGIMLTQLGKNEEAILQFQKILRLTDKSIEANLGIARAYANLQKYDLAREYYEKAIKIYTEANSNGIYDEYILQVRKEMTNLPIH